MAQTFTSTAYSATPRFLHAGVTAVSFDYSTPAGTSLSASAGAVVIWGPKIPFGTDIHLVVGSHSSGAATFPVDIGVDSDVSALASAKAAGANAINAKSSSIPYRISGSDDATAQYRVLKLTGAPGTDTAVARFQYTVFYQAKDS
jgi:hypothetical protein